MLLFIYPSFAVNLPSIRRNVVWSVTNLASNMFNLSVKITLIERARWNHDLGSSLSNDLPVRLIVPFIAKIIRV